MIWWNIYFCIYTVIMVFATIGFFVSFSSLKLGDWIGIILFISLYLSTYAYVFNKKSILETKWWATIFWVNIILLVEGLLDLYILNGAIENALPFLKSGLTVTNNEVILNTLLTLPALYATYLLGNIQNFSTKAKK